MSAAGPLALLAVGKASSSKKVQRAAKAAASSRGTSEKRELGFPLTIAAVVILGVALVLIARESREVVAPTTDDHWHSAYTVYDCGMPVAEFTSTTDPDGIHTHQDGLIHIHPFNKPLDGYPEILQILKTEEQRLNNGARWHSDQMYTPRPAKGTMLVAREMPPYGGDTLFSNLHLAYSSLSFGMRQMLAKLRGINNGDSKKYYKFRASSEPPWG